MRRLLSALGASIALIAGLCLPGLVFLVWESDAVKVTRLRRDVMRVDEDDLPRFEPNLRKAPYGHGQMHTDPNYETIRISTNAEGFRDVDHELAKPAGVRRVALVGDSFFFGLDLSDEDTLAARLRESLGAGYEVFNFGVPGYNAKGMARMTETFAMKYKPDLVLYSFLDDDVSETDSTSVTRWRHRLEPAIEFLPKPVREGVRHALAHYKQLRYTLDFQVFSAFASLIDERIDGILEQFAELGRRGGHEVGIVSFDRGAISRGVDRYRAAGGRPILLYNAPYDRNPANGHPTARANRNLAAALTPLIRALVPPLAAPKATP